MIALRSEAESSLKRSAAPDLAELGGWGRAEKSHEFGRGMGCVLWGLGIGVGIDAGRERGAPAVLLGGMRGVGRPRLGRKGAGVERGQAGNEGFAAGTG